MKQTIEPNFNDLINKPFHEEGYGPDNFSCYGLAWEVFRRYGKNIPKINIAVCACQKLSQKAIDENLFRDWKEVPKTNLIAPTGLLIAPSSHEFAQHLGVYIGNYRFIHITINRNVVIDRLSEWKNKIMGYYIYVGNSK